MAEFKSLVDKMNKQKEYKPESLESEESFVRFSNEGIPGVDKPRLQGEISVDGGSAEIDNLQSEVDSLDSRVSALENA